MEVGEALIIASIISLVGMLIIFERNNINWFKRKNFLLNQQVEKLKLKKLAKDLEINYNLPKENKGLIESIKDLDVDKIRDLLGYVQKEEEEVGEEEEENIVEAAINEIIKNPELREKGKKLLDNLGSNKTEKIER